jgi:hypothetical protein
MSAIDDPKHKPTNPKGQISDARIIELARAEAAPAPDPLNRVGGGRVPDIFDDLDALKVGQEFQTGAAPTLLRQVPVRRPKATDWFRVNPDPDYRQTLLLIENKDESEVYIVTPQMREELCDEPTLHLCEVFTAKNSNGTTLIFPVRLAGKDGKWNSWHRSQHDAATLAMGQWIRMLSNKDIGGYDIKTSNRKTEPDWSKLPPFNELLRIAFRDYKIETPDHPYIRRLRDEG